MNNDIAIASEYKCPLCESMLTREKWIKITGQWVEIEKEKANIRKLLEKSKIEKANLEKKHQIEARKMAKQAEEAGMLKGIKKEKNEREKMSKLIQIQTKAMIVSNKRIQELEKQLREGKTPQTAGFDYEKEVARMLTENFPEDEIKPTGKMGDNIHFVKSNNEIVGSILYECKKTSTYNNSFVVEIKRHQETAGCTYAVVVTHAIKKGKSRFFIEDNVVVIDPLGLLDVAFLLRNTIIEMHHLKLTKDQINEKSKEILKYMQSGVFKNRMMLAIQKAEEAYNLLIKEMGDHKKIWEDRYQIYATIHANIQMVRAEIGQIITGDKNLLNEVKKLPAPGNA